VAIRKRSISTIPIPSRRASIWSEASARAMKIDQVLSNGFGLGGVNASVVLPKM
jgi:3-oxoacyl-(acyl-carrier-protein) synthase